MTYYVSDSVIIRPIKIREPIVITLIGKINGDIRKELSTRLNFKDACLNVAFVSQMEPSKINESLKDDQCILTMQ